MRACLTNHSAYYNQCYNNLEVIYITMINLTGTKKMLFDNLEKITSQDIRLGALT